MIKWVVAIAIVSAMVVLLSIGAGAVEKPKLSEGIRALAPEAGPAPELSATLNDPDKRAQEQTATVELKVSGIQLIDSAAVHEQPRRGQGHVHYQVDTGPVIATTATKLSFHALSSGSHKITVMLVDNAHQPLGPRATLTVNIPPALGDRAQH